MEIKQIYRLIEKELRETEGVLVTSLKETKNESILKINRFLLASPGKRLRPVLTILSAKAASNFRLASAACQLADIAAAVELIHIASLVHDDVIDYAALRHNKPTINRKWGSEASIALGDYLYSLGFGLVSRCRNTDILGCVSAATKNMCEGELIQVCERDDLNLLKERYITIVKKKTASLFAASCQAGTMLVNRDEVVQGALKEYGVNFGITFQIIDDYLDLVGRARELGKTPGADFKMGELTLPVLNLLLQDKDKNKIMSLLKQQNKKEAFVELKERFIHSPALLRTKADANLYIQKAKKSLIRLKESRFKKGLFALTDYLADRISIS